MAILHVLRDIRVNLKVEIRSWTNDQAWSWKGRLVLAGKLKMRGWPVCVHSDKFARSGLNSRWY